MIQLYENLQEREGGWGKAQRLLPSPRKPIFPATAPPPHRKPSSRREDRRIHAHTTKSAKKRRKQKGQVPSAPGRRRKHGREMKALVLVVKLNPKAPLLAWAAHPYPLPRAALKGHSVPRDPRLSPSGLYPSIHPPPAQRAGTVQSSLQTVLGVGHVCISLDTGIRTSQEVCNNINNKCHLLGALTWSFINTIPSAYTYVA